MLHFINQANKSTYISKAQNKQGMLYVQCGLGPYKDYQEDPMVVAIFRLYWSLYKDSRKCSNFKAKI